MASILGSGRALPINSSFFSFVSRGDLIQMYKIVHNIDKVDKSNRFQIITNQVRGHCFKYFKEITRQQHRENFFYNRTANLWNALPSDIVQAPTVNSFKAACS